MNKCLLKVDKNPLFGSLFVFCLLTVLFYMGAAINAPNSGENYGFFIEQSICSNGSGVLCKTQESGVYAIPEVATKWQCVGEHFIGVECRSQNIDQWVDAENYEESRMGKLNFKVNGYIIV